MAGRRTGRRHAVGSSRSPRGLAQLSSVDGDTRRRAIAIDPALCTEGHRGCPCGGGLTTGGLLRVKSTVTAGDFVCSGGNCINGADIAANTILAADIGDGLGLSEINEAVFQQRVTGTCAAGNSIRAIAQSGTVTCEPDDGADGTGGTTDG